MSCLLIVSWVIEVEYTLTAMPQLGTTHNNDINSTPTAWHQDQVLNSCQGENGLLLTLPSSHVIFFWNWNPNLVLSRVLHYTNLFKCNNHSFVLSFNKSEYDRHGFLLHFKKNFNPSVGVKNNSFSVVLLQGTNQRLGGAMEWVPVRTLKLIIFLVEWVLKCFANIKEKHTMHFLH